MDYQNTNGCWCSLHHSSTANSAVLPIPAVPKDSRNSIYGRVLHSCRVHAELESLHVLDGLVQRVSHIWGQTNLKESRTEQAIFWEDNLSFPRNHSGVSGNSFRWSCIHYCCSLLFPPLIGSMTTECRAGFSLPIMYRLVLPILEFLIMFSTEMPAYFVW